LTENDQSPARLSFWLGFESHMLVAGQICEKCSVLLRIWEYCDDRLSSFWAECQNVIQWIFKI